MRLDLSVKTLLKEIEERVEVVWEYLNVWQEATKEESWMEAAKQKTCGKTPEKVASWSWGSA